MKQLRQKRTKAVLSCLLMVAMLLNILPIQVKAQETTRKATAVAWLSKACTEKQEWEESGLPNLTCNALALLREEGEETASTYLKEWIADKETFNIDEMAHLTWATVDSFYHSQLWEHQNADGGFGLTKDYTSDVYDTLLVLQAELALREAQQGIETASGEASAEDFANVPSEEQLQKAVSYLVSQQREDGGFSYTRTSESDVALSADIGTALSKLGIKNDAFYEGLDAYCLDVFEADFSEEKFIQQAKLAGYLYERDHIKNSEQVEEALYALQKENGSVYDSVEDTLRYILLLNQIERYHQLRFQVESMVTEADSYVLEAGEEQTVAIGTKIEYTTNQELQGMVRYTLLEDGTVIHTEDVESTFVPRAGKIETTASVLVTAAKDKEYILRIEVISKDEEGNEIVWNKEEVTFSVHIKEVKDFILETETSSEEGYGVKLSWTDVSNEDDRYGYRVFRKKGEGDWETRSTWDGEEKVRVLNVYPADYAKNYLKTWMETTLSDSSEPAGKGLFEIDTVYIDEYNTNPEAYLLDENGEYKYDVLVFGICNGNGWKNLSQLSYEATEKYMDSGRGVLLGHDTVNDVSYTSYFAKFADRLGIVVKSNYGYWERNVIKVVSSGFLTSYPWKISGTLTIAPTHTSGQFVGGTLPAKVWIELETPYETDEATGAKTNGYLFSNNQLAMIQTGHSNGQATDDERRVLANTLFYLKQLTNETSAEDKSAYDEQKPVITDVSEVNEDNQVTLQAKDEGTLYQYYVEAVNTNSNRENRESNIVEAKALSGVKGYIVVSVIPKSRWKSFCNTMKQEILHRNY